MLAYFILYFDIIHTIGIADRKIIIIIGILSSDSNGDACIDINKVAKRRGSEQQEQI